MGTFGDYVVAFMAASVNLLVKAEDERNNREYAKSMGCAEDGLLVAIMNYTSMRKRQQNGFKI